MDPECNKSFKSKENSKSNDIRNIMFNDKKGEDKKKINIQQSEIKDCKQYLQTINENEKSITKKEIDRAKAALDLQEYLGCPSTQEFINIMNGNEIRNININVDDIKRAINLYGLPTPCLKGKMKRR